MLSEVNLYVISLLSAKSIKSLTSSITTVYSEAFEPKWVNYLLNIIGVISLWLGGRHFAYSDHVLCGFGVEYKPNLL